MITTDRPLSYPPVIREAAHPRWRISEPALLLLFVAAHIPLGILLRQVPQFGLIHAFGTLGIGLFWALVRGPAVRVAYVGAYIVGAEVLWRMTRVPVFWEAGKYFTIAILVVALLARRTRHIPLAPLWAFLLLLPSVLLTLGANDWGTARDYISFNLSGPTAVFVCAWFFSNLEVRKDDLRRMLLIMVAPVASIAAVAIYVLSTAGNVTWSDASNFTASGGFGPNQVSSVLGLGLLIVWLVLLHLRLPPWSRMPLVAMGLWLLVQSLLTFSRGGVFNALIPGLVMSGQAFLRRGQRSIALLLLIVGAIIYVTILAPQLDQFTQGAFSVRFSDTDSTNRDAILVADLEVFIRHPLAGVGPGNLLNARLGFYSSTVAAHTEYSRLLGEHGLLGLTAMLLMIAAVWRNYIRSAGDDFLRDLIIVMGLWAAVFMMHTAMRLVAPAFAIGLTFATIASAPPSYQDRRIIEQSDLAE